MEENVNLVSLLIDKNVTQEFFVFFSIAVLKSEK